MSPAQRAYQAGLTRQEAASTPGVHLPEFDRLVVRYQDASIPLHELYGFTPTVPYSCSYHNPPAAQRLRDIVNHERV